MAESLYSRGGCPCLATESLSTYSETDPREGGGGPAGLVFEVAPYGACLGGGGAAGVGIRLNGAPPFGVGIMGLGAGCIGAGFAWMREEGCRGLGGGP